MEGDTIKTLRGLSASPYNLLEMLSNLMNDKMLFKIAEADYGHEASYCLEVLKKIKKTKRTPDKVPFILREVLELTRWQVPETREGHQIRAFACTNLVILEAATEMDDENSTLATLIESLLALGSKYYKPAYELITWRILEEYQKEQERYQKSKNKDHYNPIDIFFLYTLFLLMLLNREAEDKVITVLKHLLELDMFYRDPEWHTEWSETFLLGLTNYDQRHDVWKYVTKEILPQMGFITNEKVREKILEMMDCICHEKMIDIYNEI